MPPPRLCLLWLTLVGSWSSVAPEVLTPPYFNIAEKRKAEASFTCGENVQEPELYCKLVGAVQDYHDLDKTVISGQICDYCEPLRPDKSHPPSLAVDGSETYWISPPLSRGPEYNQINFTISLGQEFHVAYVIIKMGISPRPGLWVLERSADNGLTYKPWQYFAETVSDCEHFFGSASLEKITKDDSVICTTEFSKIIPLEHGEIVVSLLNGRPSSEDFFNSSLLQEWTRATNVRLRLMRTQTLLGHLMSVERQDPTVTRRYFYSIKDISIGGRCRCNGHADVCIEKDDNPYILKCQCQHNTCGDNCETCCENKAQKKWRQSKANALFQCEECNCNGHSETCVYNETIDALGLSMDIHGKMEGGGECKNCRDNTEGINCQKCKPGFYKPYSKSISDIDACVPCDCDGQKYTGNCEEGSGRCECKPNYVEPLCDACTFGYTNYPECEPCRCSVMGTIGSVCDPIDNICPCKPEFFGERCDQCNYRFYNYPECSECNCDAVGSLSDDCDKVTGECECKVNFAPSKCDSCADGFYDFPDCLACKCDIRGTIEGICDKGNGTCLCKEGFDGSRCDQCVRGYKDFPNCVPCNCSEIGSSSNSCDISGKCACFERYSGKTCDQCSPGYYNYPKCLECGCDPQGSYGRSCNSEGYCTCKPEFEGKLCDRCKEGYYNYPLCESCDCVPAGVTKNFSGCGSQIAKGLLCECKPRVTGRRCGECKPLYWNLKEYFPEGCIDCDCYTPGVMGGIAECDDKNGGQCYCKSSVVSRQCKECADGSYNLQDSNVFGCTDCGCDIGGSLDSICNKTTGACKCRNRIEGRTCNVPLEQHYFPTLHQLIFEVEDGLSPENVPVRFGFNESDFPGFSWKGYAYFSRIQDSIKMDIYIERAAFYRILIRYVNKGPEPIVGTIFLRPVSDAEQILKVVFPPSKEPAFVTVSGLAGNIPSPFIVAESNGKQWEFVLNIEKGLLVDYFVLLPASYFEGNILVEDVKKPCTRQNAIESLGRCLTFTYPSLSTYKPSHTEQAYRDTRDDPLEETHQEEFGDLGTMAKLSPAQPSITFDLNPGKREPFVLVVNYYSPADTNDTVPLILDVNDYNHIERGKVHLTPCRYAWSCRQVVLDSAGRFGYFNRTSDKSTVTLKLDTGSPISDPQVAIHSIAAIPASEWSPGFIKPSPQCVMIDGVCQVAPYPPSLDLKRIELENESGVEKSLNIPESLFDKSVGLVSMRELPGGISVAGKVMVPGNFIFITHYSQPFHPDFKIDISVNSSGQMFNGVLHIDHCPSNVGCRATLRDLKGNHLFPIKDDYILTFHGRPEKFLWLDYVLVAPEGKFKELLMSEGPVSNVDRYREECGKNHFYIDPNKTSEFCRDSIYTVTTQFNNGALRCMCDPQGSKSLKCNQFGGQCDCKDNVIGRRCEECRTGYYGFPNYCKPCDCPLRASCDRITGECKCPFNVEGESCEKCKPNTYAYDVIYGCLDCNCDPLGVDGKLQCDETDGTCPCRENIAGRTCNVCQPGFHGFPMCEECDCDVRGTSEGVCDAETADCLCKDNVEGSVCDICKEGSFNIDEENPRGCTECFCFNRTNICSSSRLYKNQILDLNNWSVVTIRIKKIANITEQPTDLERLDGGSLGIDLTLAQLTDQQVYFSVSDAYLGNKLKSYGGTLSYSVFCTTGVSGEHVSGPDVILSGAGLLLLHYSLELPRANIQTDLSVKLLQSNFQFFNGLTVSREQFMQVLQDLQAIYIRATYWEKSVTTSINNVLLDTASDNYTGLGLALSIEECLCPPQYTGLSCEECADGYYRSSTGSFGGFCVPCQCNNHADTCDKVTGVCINCQHDTVGNHCEQCAEGYHGDSTHGTPDDCLICACPLPIASNNFATKCEFSADGERRSCECKPGYYGDRCEACAAGFYGTPETIGSVCKACNCSGNVDLHQNGSCDSVTGRCENCLYNTAGPACNYCKSWFFGDAVTLKNCQSCSCETCGSSRCNHSTGLCECKPNVEGEKCDRCVENHYGYDSCQGCKPCNCQEASESKQCDDRDGKCRCKPGVTGTTCDKCAEGYWNYTSAGCTVCSCNEGFSEGVGCDPVTGTCHCLRDVVGEKCDSCPHRWVLVKSEGGCLECDKCAHDLLDETDKINAILQPISDEFESVALSHYSKRRLIYINETVDLYRPKVEQLQFLDISTLRDTVDELEDNVTRNEDMKNRAWSKVNNDVNHVKANLKTEALKVAEEAIAEAKDAVDGVRDIAEGFDSGSGPKLGISNLEFDESLKEAKDILESVTKELTEVSKINDIKKEINETHLAKANKALDGILHFKEPVDKQEAALLELKSRIKNLDEKIADLKKNSFDAAKKAGELNQWTKKQKDQEIPKRYAKINELNALAMKNAESTDEILRNVTNLLSQSSNNLLTQFLNEKDRYSDNSGELEELLRNKLKLQVLDELEGQVSQAMFHASQLENQAKELQRVSMTNRDDTNAIQAYNKIVNILRDALITAEMAHNVSESAEVTSEGLGDKAEEAEGASNLLAQEANSALDRSKEVENKLNTAVEEIQKLNRTKDELMEEINWIDNAIEKVSPKNPDEAVIGSAERSSRTTDEILQTVGNTLEDIKDLKNLTKQLVNDKSDGISAVNQTTNFLDEVSSILPGVKDSAQVLSSRPPALKTLGSDLKQKLDNLKKQIDRARYAANKINLGVFVSPYTFLELKIPQNLPEQEINNYLSLFFKSHVADGLLLFLGNEKAVDKRAKRTISTGDFVALELQNWQLRLTVDLGDGPTSILSDKIISGDHWYQAIIERTGKSLRLTVNVENENKTTDGHIKEGIVKGQATVLNIDKSSSKLFVGGMSPEFNHPSAVHYESFNGRVADVVVGDSVVGLWNFEDQKNISATRRRSELERTVTSTGCRFNGDGWVSLESKPYIRAMERKSQVSLDFSTLAKDGLLFLSHNGSTFLSIEIREGRIMFQYNLGSGLAYIITPDAYNDGKWHHVEISRLERKGKLRVDGTDIGDEQSPGDNTKLMMPSMFYFGGYPKDHDILEVTHVHFDGCIDQVKFDSAADLNQYSESFGVKPGCPEKVASVVSFEEGAHGYVVWPNISRSDNKAMELILRFKTMSTEGLLAFALYDQSSISLRLEEGQLVVYHGSTRLLKSQALNPYNDSEWHVVLVTYDESALKLIVDDSGSYNLPDPPRVRMLHGSLYFGGVPSVVDAEAAIAPKYAGCVSDATLNGVIINFGNLTEIPNAIIGKCVLHPKPLARPLPPPHSKPHPPITADVDRTTSTPIIPETPTKPSKVYREDNENCKLPLYPVTEESSEETGLKLGASPNSRLEFVNVQPKIKHKYEFSIDVKTKANEGVIFFTANPRSPDYITVFLKDGKVNYGWDLGSGEAHLESNTVVNDDQWHTIVFKRQGESGTLLIDDNIQSEGKSPGQTKSLNVSAPFYVGGISPAVPKEKQTVLKGVNGTLDGCVRNVMLNGHPFNRDRKQRLDFGAIPCSDQYENGVYFSPEGGYIEQKRQYLVGKNFKVALEIKPRVLSGVLLAIHGEKDYLVLELDNGVLSVKISSGNVSIINSYASPSSHMLCDGNWHTVTLTKFKHVVQIGVDTNYATPTAGDRKKQSLIRSKHPLYIGGHPTMNVPGIDTKKQYVGCIRLLYLNESEEPLNFKGAIGNVTLNACPLT